MYGYLYTKQPYAQYKRYVYEVMEFEPCGSKGMQKKVHSNTEHCHLATSPMYDLGDRQTSDH